MMISINPPTYHSRYSLPSSKCWGIWPIPIGLRQRLWKRTWQPRRSCTILSVTKGKRNTRSQRCIARKQYVNHSLYTCAIKNGVNCAENFILNLLGYVLSTPEKLLLSKRLPFIPTARDVSSFEILADFNKFVKKLCNKVHHLYLPLPEWI